jgi:hypothetical protein
MRRLARFVGVLLIATTSPALSQTATPVAPAPPAQVGELLRLLDDPGVKTWLAAQRAAPPATGGLAEAETRVKSMSERLSERMDVLENHVESVVEAIPTLPAELDHAYDRLQTELRGLGILKIVLLMAAFTLLGFGLERLFWRLIARMRAAAAERRVETLAQRLQSVGIRLAIDLAAVAVFGLGSIGVFLIFAWPPVLREVLLAYLIALLVTRLAIALSRVLLVPRTRGSEDPERHRVIPASSATAQFWDTRIIVLVT